MSNINLSLVPEDEVPPAYRSNKKWDKILCGIPSGYAAVFEREEVHPTTARGCLNNRQKRGKYLNYIVVARGKKTYIVHLDSEFTTNSEEVGSE